MMRWEISGLSWDITEMPCPGVKNLNQFVLVKFKCPQGKMSFLPPQSHGGCMWRSIFKVCMLQLCRKSEVQTLSSQQRLLTHNLPPRLHVFWTFHHDAPLRLPRDLTPTRVLGFWKTLLQLAWALFYYAAPNELKMSASIAVEVMKCLTEGKEKYI